MATRLRDGTSKLIDNFEALDQHHEALFAVEISRLRQRWTEEAQLVARLEGEVSADRSPG